jgi:general secretion pathway protein A
LTELAQFYGQESAYQALFKQWGATFNGQEKENVCQQAEKQGLRCLSGRGGLEDLRKWNRPAVLKLSDGRSKELYATLTALREDMAAFTVGDETLMVMRDDLLGGWLGEYTLLWRPPPGYRASLQTGQKGPLVEWLKARLSRIQDTAVDVSSHAVFDSALEEEVKKFQLSSDLTPDGIVGPQTLSRLISESDASDAPVLTERKKEP